MHSWCIPFLKSIDRVCEVWAETFVFDLLDRVEVGFKGEDDGEGFGEAVQGLTLAADEGL